MVKVGDKIPTWWQGTGEILEILPYKGIYRNYFNCTLKIQADRSPKGWILMAFKNE